MSRCRLASTRAEFLSQGTSFRVLIIFADNRKRSLKYHFRDFSDCQEEESALSRRQGSDMLSRLWMKPNVGHALAQGGLAAAFALVLTLPITWELTARATYAILQLGGIPALLVLAPNDPTLYVKAADGRIAAFAILVECSGLVTVAIFGLILAATMGLLQGPLWFKFLWTVVGTFVGILWNVNRLVLSASSAHYIGFEAFEAIHFIFSPMVDFLWMVVVWSLGMSLMSRWAPEVGL
jgi:exosortase/archaeosortase family protein